MKAKSRADVLQLAACLHAAELLASPAPTVRVAPPAAELRAVVRDEPPAQTEARLHWFREARFGMFVHWGVYAIPAGFWKVKLVSVEWFMNRGKMSVADCKALGENFITAKYDPEAWAQFAADGGAKYVVIRTKHHDGFALGGGWRRGHAVRRRASSRRVGRGTRFDRSIEMAQAAAQPADAGASGTLADPSKST
jgi:hypothetical protein